MKLTEILAEDLAREAVGIRKALERVPEGREEWRPHGRSMPLGYLSTLVATMPGWIPMMVNHDQWDIDPPGGPKYKPEELHTAAELAAAFDRHVAKAREVLMKTTDEHLMKPWRFMVGGHVASEQPRHIMIRDAVMNHLVHHCGQLTVYLRLNEAPVPAIYGPSADEGAF